MSEEQGNLFEGLPFQRHSETSRAAAEAAEPSAGTQRRAVFDILRKYPDGLIDEEIQRKLAMNPSTERPRRIELVESGLVIDSGQQRNTASGRKAVIWQLTTFRERVA